MRPLLLVEVEKAIGRRLNGGKVERFSGVSSDSRTVQAGDLFVAIRGERFDGHDFVKGAFEKGALGAVVSRPFDSMAEHSDKAVFLVPDTTFALGEIAKAYRASLGARIIGVTGSNGKTTTREMIYHLLSKHFRVVRAAKSFNNFIGVPLTLFQIEPDDEYAVIEMGTSAPGEIARLAEIAQPDLGVITNVSATHLAGLGSEEGVANAKAEILDAMGEDGVAILNRDNRWTERIAGRCRGRVITFGEGAGADVRATSVAQNGEAIRFQVEGTEFRLPVVGRHNVLNALAALAVCRHLGLGLEELRRDFSDFQLPSMRLQREVLGGVTVINDAYNANPVSMGAAIDTFAGMSAGRKIFVCGDMLELGPDSARLHGEVGAKLAQARPDFLWTVGQESRHTADAAKAGGLSPEKLRHADSSEAAGAELAAFVRPGDLVFLKGSRGMALEKVLERVRARLEPKS